MTEPPRCCCKNYFKCPDDPEEGRGRSGGVERERVSGSGRMLLTRGGGFGGHNKMQNDDNGRTKMKRVFKDMQVHVYIHIHVPPLISVYHIPPRRLG